MSRGLQSSPGHWMTDSPRVINQRKVSKLIRALVLESNYGKSISRKSRKKNG